MQNMARKRWKIHKHRAMLEYQSG